MDNASPIHSAADLELRAARVADPSIDLKTKYMVACELREMIDTVGRDAEARVLPHMIPVLLEILRSGEPSFQKDSLDFQFRRSLLEILHRIPFLDVVRPQVVPLFHGLLHLLRHDNEEMGVTCCKMLNDIMRGLRSFNEEVFAEYMAIFQQLLENLKALLIEAFSEDSRELDVSASLPAIRSFKVLSEVNLLLATFLQINRTAVVPHISALIPRLLEYSELQPPAQQKAREDFEAMGGIWAGLAPTVKNVTIYSDYIISQIRVISSSLYLLRALPEQYEAEGEKLTLALLRLFQDCPAMAISARKELIPLLRHLTNTVHKRALIPHVGKLLDEQVLLGTSVGGREIFRASLFSAVADLLHHLRADLTPAQIHQIFSVYMQHLHNPFLSSHAHLLSAKMIFNLIDGEITKDSHQSAARVLTTLLEASVDKVDSLVSVQVEKLSRVAKDKEGIENDFQDFALIEKSRPLLGPCYATEKPEENLGEYRNLLRTLFHGFNALIVGLKKVDAPVPDGALIARMFDGCIRAIVFFDGEPREAHDALERLGLAMVEINLHVFQEVWTQKIAFYFSSAEKRPVLMHLATLLFAREATSPTLVAIVLRYLIDRLPELGEYDDQAAAVAIRMFKMTFQAVTTYPQLNESILASHLGKLIMDCFPLAAKAAKPTNYFHLLRGLFRAIGGGGGRFELLYKEVLPLLPEMLECLNRQLQSSDGPSRDMIVELCLTVPLRLTHLLPYLSYLMQPLVLALRGTTELISQGLRTLELCIDNLTPDFLDPTLNTVLRELMEALHDLLKPLPGNHHHSHTTIRILGKLGGRNRKLLEKEPSFKYSQQTESVKARFSFGAQMGNIELEPVARVSCETLRNPKSAAQQRVHAYNYLEQCLTLVLHEGVKGREREELFVRCLESMYDALHLSDVQEKAEKTLKEVSRFLFTVEVRRYAVKDDFTRRYPSPIFSCYLDAVQYGLARDKPEEAKRALELISTSIRELVGMATASEVAVNDVVATLHQVASRFLSLCLEEAWVKRSAGCGGIQVMTDIPDLGVRWVNQREVDLVRMLLHVLKDMPHDMPHDADKVIDVLNRVLRVSTEDSKANDSEQDHDNKITQVVGLFFAELSSPNPIVRKAAQGCISLLAELSGKTIVDLLMPHRDRMLASIYTKPLRALPFPLQIGMIEGIRYCISLQPPLPELNDELLRLLHETLALADADDMALVGRNNPRQSAMDIIKLRVACIKLLTASMPMTDFFSKQHQTRQRVTAVYFKSLYSPTPMVKDVAHEGLRMVLTHQARLPKELLQTGLRPILMNLADPKKLSIPGLEGLARLLELLTNYFKVEIGHKLLDHFRIVADPQMLQASSRLPLMENDGIKKLVCLANIFHLLPSAANIFLENLVNAIVQTESALHFSGESPFSAPLAKYLDRYPSDAMDYFMRHLAFPMQIRTLRSILRANLAPNLLRELNARTGPLVTACLEGRDPNIMMPGLLLCSDLAELVPGWVLNNHHAVDAVIALWKSDVPLESSQLPSAEALQKYTLMLSIFKQALEQSPRIDILFDLVLVFARRQPLDVVSVIQFMYRHVALSKNLAFRRNILLRFLIWFDDPAPSWTQKALFLQYVVTPMLLMHATHSPSKAGLVDADIVQRLHTKIWQPMAALEKDAFSGSDDTFKIELLRLTTVMIQHYSDFLQEAKKDIIKCAWAFIGAEDPLVKCTAYVLAARFFNVLDGPPKFILRLWTGLLKGPNTEGKLLVRQALDILAPVLSRPQMAEAGYPQWAKTTRRLLAEDGVNSNQTNLVYHLIVAQSSLFFPVRALFVPHIVNHLSKLGLLPTSNLETRILSIDIIQVIFDWEQRAAASAVPTDESEMAVDPWTTPLSLRENMVSYLIRLATLPQDLQSRSIVIPRALSLLRTLIAPGGWNDVNVKLNYFSRTLEQSDLSDDAQRAQALANAKVLQVISAERDDAWFQANAPILTKLVRKGMFSEDQTLQDCLYPVTDRLLRLFPLPKEDDQQAQGEISEFHAAIYSSIGDNLRSSESLRPGSMRGSLLVLKTVVQVAPERIDPFCSNLMKLLSKLAKDHIQSSASNGAAFETLVRLLIAILEVCHIAVAHLSDQRKWLLSTLVVLVDKSKSIPLCRYLLDIAKDWAVNKRDAYPSMKEKASLLQKMVAFESRGGDRGEVLFNNYLELIYDIYTDPSLRRSDLTARLEQSFLLGCRAADPTIRERFIDLLDNNIPRSLHSRLTFVCGSQNWESLADHNWIFLALHLLLGSIDGDHVVSPERRSTFDSTWSQPPFLLARASAFIKPMQRLLFMDRQAAHDVWISFFSSAWACLGRPDQRELANHMIALLAKEYHVRQAEMRPNVIITLLAGIHACSSPMVLPPHLVKYLAKTFGAWHIAAEMLEASLNHIREDEVVVRDTIYDSLAEIYAELSEEDVFYGLWRRRSLYPDTNAGISFEQAGMWEQASIMYEAAQTKARAGILPFSESEFCLWEDHWILASEKLQHWEILYELGKSEGNPDLQLEAAWRTKDWVEQKAEMEATVSQLREVATPRRRVYEAFLALLKLPAAIDKNTEFTKILEEAMQLTLRKWVTLPHQFSSAHVPLLQHFQQFVELQEAVQIFGSLATTNAQNLEKKSSDLKMVLQAWRERLPNVCDDITTWSDLVAWRQNVFNSINKTYLPLIQPSNQGSAATGSTNTFGYRGFHETAWIINRFAHVARKHELLDVCFTFLNRIYTLPNIEISEAFLKLREQARCHYQKPGDLQAGLEVINNTNLMYFSNPQKAEFFTLKGMFYARLGRSEDANSAFGHAVQMDMFQAKAWAAWGKFNDKMFKEAPNEMSHASNAVSCYLQAAGLYKNRKSRPLLTRVLWLLSVDDGTLAISQAFDKYKGDAAFWYWITLIPQLCLSVSQREAKQARYILLNLAKLYPQALFFPLRTTKEDMNLLKRQQAAAQAQAQAQAAARASSNDGKNEDGTPSPSKDSSQPKVPLELSIPLATRQSWDLIDEIVQILKTAFPLLILTLETVVEQIAQRFKASPEEEIYRLTCMLLQDAMQQYIARMANDDDGQLSPGTVATLIRLAVNLSGSARKDYEEDFIKSKPTLNEYIRKLQQWRDKYERLLDARPRVQSLENLGPYLIEFQYTKFDEVEVPGQYTEEKDSNNNFVRIRRFGPKYENCRSHGYCWRRLSIKGHDGSSTSFAVQLPSGRHCRREDRTAQIFRTLNGTLMRKKESRKRNLHFHLPAAVSCAPNLRLLQNDASYISLGDIYDQHCEDSGMAREEPVLIVGEKVKTTVREFKQRNGRPPSRAEVLLLKNELLNDVMAKAVPADVLTRYVIRTMRTPDELWRMRKEFALQLAATSFMTYFICLGSRLPSRFHWSRATGQIAMSESLPGHQSNNPNALFTSQDAVPFRFTPNMQHLLGPIFTEGILAASIMSIGRCLTEPECELEHQLCLFVRDEVMTWMHQHYRRQQPQIDVSFRMSVSANIESVIKRAETMACKIEREQQQTVQTANTTPVVQTVANLISTATNPLNLVKMGEAYVPWF
ncbi:atypical/PIKK/TRRAP protein kinase [Dichomitus squalens LYAD-421 SS1]|uniref:Atypical/PIKK/TRRAP protein kinase n=1 Tax=Dichomitus squalens (strain LYAD-421) TaxID=732165 RepID=R7SZU9_DICSQ|nr:atypical/PIKK/TRRAP protein kinase [Dichomitus squalens LYAD-421 SS1]EJF61235.1 atypical/PIKK/TRRAP protein kinase [Dichomitus squalens LYAD-421 SS1]